ncbi:MAG TPA: hypothetical protein VK689_23315, partial [Armatimonadota bacterium]|nr:hypothetical protein [Armatimonadota bacterium]
MTALLLALAGAFGARAGAAPEPARLVHTSSIREAFGVAHPRQLIDFDAAPPVDPKRSYVIGPDGTEVPYQILRGGKLAVLTDLPASASRSWKLYTGRAPAPARGGVELTKSATHYEVTNGLTGVRIPLPPARLTPTPAPIQGVRYRDGRWTATGPNSLSIPAASMEVRLVEQGPLKVVAEVVYRFAAPGAYYKSTIEVQARQPSILLEEETTTDLSYSLDLHVGLQPTEARYRGARSTSKEAGRDAAGQRFSGHNGKVAWDAFVDLQYQAPRDYPRLTRWEPWIEDSGWYWMLYDAGAPASANLLGLFGGRSSRLIGAPNSGVNVFTRPAEDGRPPATGITVSSYRKSESGRTFPRSRFHWGLFLGTKGEDLRVPAAVQPINVQMNLHGGINLNKIHRVALEYPDPKRRYGALYMDRAVLDRHVARLRADKEGPQGKGHYNRLYHADSYFREMLAIWADPTAEKIRAATAAIEHTAREFLEAMVNGKGIYDGSPDQMVPSYAYWMGGLEMQRKALWIDQLLALPSITPEVRAKAKAVAALFGHVLWDDDFVPLFEGHGMNLGNPNMPVMQQGLRSFFTLFLAEHPAMRPRVPQVERETLKSLNEIVNEHGASMSATNYIGAGFTPTLNLLLQLRMLGRDRFKSEARLPRFAEFYLNLLTPPEVRFGGPRKLVAIGDSSTQRSELFGALGTGFRSADPSLSARLMGAWRAAGRPHASFFGTSLVKIDEEAPAKDPALQSATFPGYYSVLRHGWGTPNETALWFINGDYYHDHRHQDQGSVLLYALGAPLSLDWGPIYYPQVAGGFMHSMVLPESAIGAADTIGHPPAMLHGWDQDSPPLHTAFFVWGVPPWGKATQDSFLSFERNAGATAHFTSSDNTTWTRSVYSIHPDAARPVLLIRDRFAGKGEGASKVFSLNLTAQGDVETPAGKVTPPLRTFDAYGNRTPDKKELPSAGKVFPLAPGLNRLGFTGQWKIDWDLYTYAEEAQQAHVGNWGHHYHPHTEQAEFEKANGRPFEERQHILRIRGSGGFNALILPYPKGKRPDDLKVTRQGAETVITGGGAETRVGDDFFAFRSSAEVVLAAFAER